MTSEIVPRIQFISTSQKRKAKEQKIHTEEVGLATTLLNYASTYSSTRHW